MSFLGMEILVSLIFLITFIRIIIMGVIKVMDFVKWMRFKNQRKEFNNIFDSNNKADDEKMRKFIKQMNQGDMQRFMRQMDRENLQRINHDMHRGSMDQGLKSGTPFEQGGYDMGQGNSFNEPQHDHGFQHNNNFHNNGF